MEERHQFRIIRKDEKFCFETKLNQKFIFRLHSYAKIFDKIIFIYLPTTETHPEKGETFIIAENICSKTFIKFNLAYK